MGYTYYLYEKEFNKRYKSGIEVLALKLEEFKPKGLFIDSHIHLWLERFNGYSETAAGQAFYQSIRDDLIKFKSCSGSCLIECTPYGFGRDGNVLKRLSFDSAVKIISVTGFHKQLYYPEDFFLWRADVKTAEDFFVSEVEECLFECRGKTSTMSAEIIKIPFTGELEGQYLRLTTAAINASLKTGTPILVHTDQGLNVEKIAAFLEEKGIEPSMVTLHHVDKRPDLDLHVKLAEKGYLLEYDTFLRPKYEPDKNLWPLIANMVKTGYANSIAVGSDIYENEMWNTLIASGGLSAFFNSIKARLVELKIPEEAIKKITGGNASDFLSNKKIQ